MSHVIMQEKTMKQIFFTLNTSLQNTSNKRLLSIGKRYREDTVSHCSLMKKLFVHGLDEQTLLGWKVVGWQSPKSGGEQK